MLKLAKVVHKFVSSRKQHCPFLISSFRHSHWIPQRLFSFPIPSSRSQGESVVSAAQFISHVRHTFEDNSLQSLLEKSRVNNTEAQIRTRFRGSVEAVADRSAVEDENRKVRKALSKVRSEERQLQECRLIFARGRGRGGRYQQRR